MKNLEEQIRQWNDENEFEKCVEAIEAVPEAERGYELTLLLGRAYSNIAVLGPHCERPDGDADKVDRELPRQGYIYLRVNPRRGRERPVLEFAHGIRALDGGRTRGRGAGVRGTVART